MKPAEIARAVVELSDDFELAKGILIAMVRAKRASTAAPDAWAAAFAAVDRWTAEDGDARPVTTVKCGECSAVLQNMSTVGPARIDCGPVHVLHYEDFYVEIGEGTATVHPYERGAGSIVAVEPAFTEDDDEGEDDADVSD